MLYFVHEIGPFHGQLSPEMLLVHEIGAFHGQTLWEICLPMLNPGISSGADPKMADSEGNSENSGLVLCGFFSFL